MQLKSPTTQIKELTLVNGLKVIVGEISQATDAYFAVSYKVSARNELPNNAGINLILAGVLLNDNESTEVNDEAGLNSFHFEDFTTYVQPVRLTDLKSVFKHHAVLMSTPKMSEATLHAEIQRRNSHRAENDVFVSNISTPKEVIKLLYPRSGYANDAAGDPTTLADLDIEQLRAWHRRWYMPNNATLTVVGNVNADNILRWAEQYFSPIPNRPLESSNFTKEDSEPGKRHIELHKNTNEPLSIMAFNLPDLATFNDDPKASGTLDIIVELLTRYFLLMPDGYGSAHGTLNQDAGIFLLSVTALSAIQSPSQLEKGLHTYLNELKQTLIDKQTLQQVRENCLTRLAEQEQNPLILTEVLLRLHYSKLPLSRRTEKHQALLSVTPMDIQGFANKYFTEPRMTTAHIFPMTDLSG